MSRTILITGASSGLGLAFIQHYASLPSPPKLLLLDTQRFLITRLPKLDPDNIYFSRIDITSPDLETFASTLSDTPISLIIHCAGVRGLVPEVVEQQRGHVAAAETLQVMNQETMLRTFEINTWGTFNVVRSFLPNLKLAAEKEDTRPKVVILSSRMGSVSCNSGGGGYAYRASKAALNAVVKSFSVDVPDVSFLLLHPGRVETGLVEWKEEGAISAQESVKDCSKVIERLGEEESGMFVDRFGERIAW
ncbi:Nn.00g037520.m01.CDS01 [Neocucurbitaria sp. VM-36]